MTDNPKPLTIEEVTSILSDIARNGEGPERFRALKMIAAQETGSVTLPEPISDVETVERLGRLMKAAGATAVHMAYRRVFPRAQRPINVGAPKVTIDDMIVDRATLPVNLKQLYRTFPEIKRPGVPQGYPRKGGLSVVKQWCQKTALRLLMDREQGRLDEASILKAKDDDATEQAEPNRPA